MYPLDHRGLWLCVCSCTVVIGREQLPKPTKSAEETMKKFKNAKSISSAQFREAQDVMNADTDPSRERLRSDFSGASAISSDAFFGKPLREREPLCWSGSVAYTSFGWCCVSRRPR